jgi:acetyl-CoA carboxylase biotin carboxyl carrier protein
MNLTHDDVQEIIKLLNNSSFDELRIETDRFKLTLRRAGSGGWTQETQTAHSEHAAADIAPEKSAVVTLEPGTIAVNAPLVGTFYRAPKPGAEPFVEVGDEVEEDTIVAIIETMKLMNSVPAGARGTVAEICVSNAGFVQHGQLLMTLKAS